MKTKLLILAITSAFFLSFTVLKENDKKIFVGNWAGSEKDQQIEGVTKYWQQTRFKDGTYIIMFTTIEECEVDQFIEKGTWYIKDGIFHEVHTNSGSEDIYEYEIIDNDHIKFKSKKMGVEMTNSNYEFIDTRLEN
jgi:hypothetical protein